MKKQFKKWLSLTLTLLLALPILANAQVKGPNPSQVAQLTKDYYEKFGKDVSEYDQDAYLQFSEFYKGSKLEEVIPSFLAQQIWKGKDQYCWDAAIAFYNDVKWHEAQGIAYDKAAEIKYAGVNNDFRHDIYKPFESPDVRTLFYGLNNMNFIYHGFEEFLTDKNDYKTFFTNYKRRVLYNFFTQDNLVSTKENPFSMYPVFVGDYVTALVFNHEEHSSDWLDRFYVDMPEDLLKNMQDHIAKYVPMVCEEQQDYMMRILHYFGEDFDRNNEKRYPQKMCDNFIKNAKKHNLWTDVAEKNLKQFKQKATQEKLLKAFQENAVYKLSTNK